MDLGELKVHDWPAFFIWVEYLKNISNLNIWKLLGIDNKFIFCLNKKQVKEMNDIFR